MACLPLPPPAWLGLTPPDMMGKELPSLQAPADFVSATDLHIREGSAANLHHFPVPAENDVGSPDGRDVTE